MRNATPVLPFKRRRPTRRHYFLRVNFRPFSFFTRTTRAKINPGQGSCGTPSKQWQPQTRSPTCMYVCILSTRWYNFVMIVRLVSGQFFFEIEMLDWTVLLLVYITQTVMLSTWLVVSTLSALSTWWRRVICVQAKLPVSLFQHAAYYC